MKRMISLAVFLILITAGTLAAAKRYGYYMNGKKVVFCFYPKKVKGKVTSVNVAGSFNGWKPTLRWWRMWHYKKGKCWVLSIPVATIKRGKRGTSGKYEFKFVVNKDQWQQPPKWAPNKAEDGYGGGNLVILDSDLK